MRKNSIDDLSIAFYYSLFTLKWTLIWMCFFVLHLLCVKSTHTHTHTLKRKDCIRIKQWYWMSVLCKRFMKEREQNGRTHTFTQNWKPDAKAREKSIVQRLVYFQRHEFAMVVPFLFVYIIIIGTLISIIHTYNGFIYYSLRRLPFVHLTLLHSIILT